MYWLCGHYSYTVTMGEWISSCECSESVKWTSFQVSQKIRNSYIKQRSHMHEFTLFLFFKTRTSILLNYSLWSQLRKPTEDDSGLCSLLIQRRLGSGSKKEGKNNLFSERKQKRVKKRKSVIRGKEISSQKCSSSISTSLISLQSFSTY